MANLIFEKGAEAVSKEEFRMTVDLWESKGHKNVVAVEFLDEDERGFFDDKDGDLAFIVRDYVDPDRSYFILATAWVHDNGEAWI